MMVLAILFWLRHVGLFPLSRFGRLPLAGIFAIRLRWRVERAANRFIAAPRGLFVRVLLI